MNDIQQILIEAIEHQNAGRIDAAVPLFERALALDPNNAAALYSLCLICLNRGDRAAALQFSSRGVAAAPGYPPIHFIHGASLMAHDQREAALKSYDRALELKPDYIEVLINSGALLRDMLRHGEALERFNRVLTFDPNYPSALANTAILLTEFKRSAEAIAMFERLLQVRPDFDYGLGLLCFERLHVCDWTDYEALSARIIDGVRAGRRVCKSLAMMAISDSARDQMLSAQIFARHFYPDTKAPLWRGERYRHRRIRVAYVSPDLREHPVAHLLAGVIERHDKSRFELTAISLGIDDGSRLRARMIAAFDRFVDARGLGSGQIATLLRELEIDIVVDLAGYTSDSRAEIFSYRAAPVQMNFLGYAGTLGTGFIDYIIADRHVIPEAEQDCYSERVLYLPDAYLPTDASLEIAATTPSRAECGLPESGIVLCAFSHDYKISPPMFATWMRILTRLPGSTLWLMSRSEISQRNLRNAAQAAGVDPARLVFAGRVPRVEDHLARYRQADLFLDTHPYNAHTTAADALMAGLPVVTLMGSAFPSRVAGSLLHAIGLPELIAQSPAEYEDKVVGIAGDPARLAALKQQLADNRRTHALFDTDAFCRNLEAIYVAAWRNAELGGARDALAAAARA